MTLHASSLFAAVACVACSNAQPAAPAAVTRDSAGIRIVENLAPERTGEAAWRLGAEPSLEIGSVEGDTLKTLFRVGGATTLSDGRVVVVNVTPPMVRWFSPAGEFLVGTGRSGGGPGEFGDNEGPYISNVWPLDADSIGTWEHPLRRLQVFGPDGRYARTIILEIPPEMHPLAYPANQGRLANGFLTYVSNHADPGPLGEVRRQIFTYHWNRYDGSHARALAQLPGFMEYTGEVSRPGRSGTFRAQLRPPFSRPATSAPHGDRFYYGSADSYEIAAYDTIGQLTLLIRKIEPARPVTRAIKDAYEQQRLAAVTDEQTRARLARSFGDLPYPDVLPAYRGLRVDRVGWLWVRDYDLPGDTIATWSIFNPDGRWITTLDVPTAYTIREIGRDYLLVTVRDELDVEFIRRYPLYGRELPR